MSANRTTNIDSKDFAIGVLGTMAVILFTAILVFEAPQAPVFADGMTVAKDDYILTVGAATRNDEDLVYVIDTSVDRMGAYRFNNGRRQIELIQMISLAEMRSGAQPAPQRSRRP
jgi:hypothetical protein